MRRRGSFYKNNLMAKIGIKLVLCLSSISGIVPVFGQSAKKPMSDSVVFNNIKTPVNSTAKMGSITFNLDKIQGIGPSGLNSQIIGATESYKDWKDFAAYPVMKNKPQNLTDVTEYFYILNDAQFFYQNYVKGVFTKQFLTDKFDKIRFNLADTIRLSRSAVKCYISALVGFNADKQPMYIIDANNNGDFADDTLKPLLKEVRDETMITDGSVAVQTSYFDDNKIKADRTFVFLQQAYNPKKFEVGFMFPEFKYGHFTYKGKPYLICFENMKYNSGKLLIVPDRPYFLSMNRGEKIGLNQVAQLGGDGFLVSKIGDNGNQITLTGDVAGFAPVANGKHAVPNAVGNKKLGDIVSRQVGFKAPLIKGFNINPSLGQQLLLSTEKLKGKYVLVDFWSTYCGPCIAEFENLSKAYAKYNRSQFEILGVVDDRDSVTTQNILRDHHVTWPNVKDSGKGTQITGYRDIQSYPTTFLLSPDGKIIATELRGDDLINKLKTLIN